MDRFRAMRTFLAIAGEGSLSAAARKLGQPLTSVSRQLAALEAHLGATLVNRTTRRFALTDAGRRYGEVCRRLLDELQAAESALAGRSGDVSGEIVLTAPVTFGRLHLLPVVTQFLAAHPGIDARLNLTDRVVDLTEEGIDVAVRIGTLPDSALLAKKVGSVRLVTCAAPAYLKAYGAPPTPADLASSPCVGFAGYPREGAWIYKSAAHGRRAVRVRARLTVTTAETAIEAAVAGVGITRVLSYQAVEAITRKQLRIVLDGYDDTEIPVHLVHRTVRQPRAQVRAFLDFASGELRARLQNLDLGRNAAPDGAAPRVRRRTAKA